MADRSHRDASFWFQSWHEDPKLSNKNACSFGQLHKEKHAGTRAISYARVPSRCRFVHTASKNISEDFYHLHERKHNITVDLQPVNVNFVTMSMMATQQDHVPCHVTTYNNAYNYLQPPIKNARGRGLNTTRMTVNGGRVQYNTLGHNKVRNQYILQSNVQLLQWYTGLNCCLSLLALIQIPGSLIRCCPGKVQDCIPIRFGKLECCETSLAQSI